MFQACIFGNQIDKAAVIIQAAAVNSKALVLVFAMAVSKAAVGISIGKRRANRPLLIHAQLFVVAQLVRIVLVLDVLVAILSLAAGHTRPHAMLALAVAQLPQAFIHIVVFLPPGHEGDACHFADALVVLVRPFAKRNQITISVKFCSYIANNCACVSISGHRFAAVFDINNIVQLLHTACNIVTKGISNRFSSVKIDVSIIVLADMYFIFKRICFHQYRLAAQSFYFNVLFFVR